MGQTEAQDQRWPICGYAPGSYCCTCRECGSSFIGDKHALRCLTCATKVRPPVCPMIHRLNLWIAWKVAERMLSGHSALRPARSGRR